MPRTVSLNGTNYTVPEPGDTSYGATLSNYLLALATAFPQISNAVEQALGAELNLGSLFGVKALYLKTQASSPSATGVARLSKTDTIGWRNNAGTADLSLGIDGSDRLLFNGAVFLSVPLSAEADFGAAAGIKALYLKSRAATIASAGILRMAGTASAEAIAWRNNANNGDLLLTVNASDQLLFNGSVVQTSGAPPNPLIAPSTASLGLEGNVSDSGSAIAVKIGNASALSTAGARIAVFYSDGLSTEKAYFDKDGTLFSDIHKARTAVSASLVGAMADGASAVGVILDNSIDLANAAAKLLSIRRAGVEKAYFDKNGGLISIAGSVFADAFLAQNAVSATLKGQVADGASAVGVVLDNINDLTNAAAKLVSFRRAGVEKAYIDKDGNLSTAAGQTWTSIFITSDQTLNASADTDMTGLSFAMVSGTYVIRGAVIAACTASTSNLDITMKATSAPTTSRIGIGGHKMLAASSMKQDFATITSDTATANANFASGTSDAAAANYEAYRTFTGTIVATGSGTFQMRAHTGGTLWTLRVGTYLEYRKIA